MTGQLSFSGDLEIKIKQVNQNTVTITVSGPGAADKVLTLTSQSSIEASYFDPELENAPEKSN